MLLYQLLATGGGVLFNAYINIISCYCHGRYYFQRRSALLLQVVRQAQEQKTE